MLFKAVCLARFVALGARLEPAGLEPFVVFLVGADPLPQEIAFDESTDGAVMIADSHGPIYTADLLEVEGGVEGIGSPEVIIFSRERSGGFR